MASGKGWGCAWKRGGGAKKGHFHWQAQHCMKETSDKKDSEDHGRLQSILFLNNERGASSCSTDWLPGVYCVMQFDRGTQLFISETQVIRWALSRRICHELKKKKKEAKNRFCPHSTGYRRECTWSDLFLTNDTFGRSPPPSQLFLACNFTYHVTRGWKDSQTLRDQRSYKL